ncbi:hypothetical protein ACWIEX_19810 [Bosea sp. NPDC055353]
MIERRDSETCRSDEQPLMESERSKQTAAATPFSNDAATIGEFLASHGGPFFDLQHRMKLLHNRALHVGRRALLFMAIAWGIPLALSLLGDRAFNSPDGEPFLLDLGAWARFFVAIGLFVLSERQVEERLRSNLAQFARAPILDPSCYASAATAVGAALRRRDSGYAELICFGLAYLLTIGTYARFHSAETSGWAISVSSTGRSFTPAGWWALLVSTPLFSFLLFRGLWRHLVWAWLLRRIASLKLRIVATHPDGKGGLAFVADYPNAYAMFVFGASSAVAVALARTVFEEGISAQAFTSVLIVWLLIVLALFAFSLQAFSAPLADLKRRSLATYGAQATRYFRHSEKQDLGSNVLVDSKESGEIPEIADPTKSYAASRKLSVFLLSRAAIVPVTFAALAPFAIVGVSQLPVKEVVSLLKKLIIL